MNWTEKQRETIETRGKNILVAAAAGSGKTAVLVERIRRMAMEEGIPLDSMLIVTFTRAAAAEMKEKIRRSLKAKLEEDPSAREQLERLSRAQISTFHSFAQRVLKEFFYFTDIEPGFRVLDEPEAEVLKEQLSERGCPERAKLKFHSMLLNGELVQTIGGGIGQSRLCMYFLRKAHIGETQVSTWSDDMLKKCREANIEIL